MPLMGSLYIGSSGLQTSQNALNTTAHNLSNVDTTGYTRQQVQQSNRAYVTLSTDPKSIANKQTGLGVTYSRVKQVRDYFLDKTYRKESGRSMFYEVSTEVMEEVESQLGELNGEAFQTTMTDFWTAVQELSKDPSSSVTQGLIVQRASEFVQRASAVYAGLSSYQDNLNTQIRQNVDKINKYGNQLLTLNDQIRAIESGGIEHANDLRDARNQILDELAEREIENGELIVYTSADSVLQICGNEETMGLETLYHYCEIARELTMKDEWKVGRVIARPYVGKKKGEFVRTANRHDYAVKPTGKTVLNAMQEAGYDVISIGKINDIFCGEGITESLKSKSSVHGMEQTIETAGKDFTGLCFVNLVDFDALWGHRRNPEGYGKEIEKFDVNLGKLLEQLKDDDLLLITADHGNDPTYTGTDHTREQVPLLAYSPFMKESGLQETKDTFAVIGASVAENFGVEMPEGTIGTSILPEWK